MDTIDKTEYTAESFVDERKLQRVTEFLQTIDPVLTPFTTRLSRPPYKDLSEPETFLREDKLKLTDLVAVRLTDNFPHNGIVHPLVYYRPEILRYSTHFSINGITEDIPGTAWSWQENKYGILIPFEKLAARVEEFALHDTIVLEDFELPEGSVIIGSQTENLPQDAGKAKVVKADFSQKGEGLSGSQAAIYKEMINLGYFPQRTSYTGAGWIWWGDRYRSVFKELCQESGLNFGVGHSHHWSWRLENYSILMADAQEEHDEEKFKAALEEMNYWEFEQGEKWFGPDGIIPDKYMEVLKNLVKKYKHDFPTAETTFIQ